MKIDGTVPGVMEAQRSLTPNYVLITTTVSIVPSAHYLPLTSSFACFSFCHHLYSKVILNSKTISSFSY